MMGFRLQPLYAFPRAGFVALWVVDIAEVERCHDLCELKLGGDVSELSLLFIPLHPIAIANRYWSVRWWKSRTP